MVDKKELRKKFEYEIDLDDDPNYIHIYYANSVADKVNPNVIQFDPLYEISHEWKGEVKGDTVIVPYSKVSRIIRFHK